MVQFSALPDQDLGAQRGFSLFSTPAGRRTGKPVLSKVCPLNHPPPRLLFLKLEGFTLFRLPLVPCNK